MLLMMLEKGMQVDDIIFCDTGVEFPELYDHIKQVEKYISRPISIVKWSGGTYYDEFCHHKKTRGDNPNGKGWASFKNRWCTQYFKERPFNAYIKNKYYGEKCIRYIGIAYDEPKRHDRIGKNARHPLFDWHVTEAKALEYCYEKGFYFGGLYTKFSRLGCYCCPFI